MSVIGIVRIPGDPYGKGSPRAVRMGKLIRIHPPKADKDYAKRVAEALQKAEWEPVQDGRRPIYVEIEAYFCRPTSHRLSSGMLSAAGRRWPWPTKKPDLDNISKIILDSFTHNNVWVDDAQVTQLILNKKWNYAASSVTVEWGYRD